MNDVPKFPRPIEFRSAKTLDVRFPDRIIEIVAVPYDEDAEVPYRGKWIMESVAPGSFDGIERRANRVKVNREHDLDRTVGRAHAFHPSRREGLVAELKISRTPLGDESLELASDGALDASIGFAAMAGGETYNVERSRRRITKAFLDHVALTAAPAYEGAQVVGVRSQSAALVSAVESVERATRVPTPFLDAILAERRLAGLRFPEIADSVSDWKQ